MSDSYGNVKGGRLTFKGGVPATRGDAIEKRKKKKRTEKSSHHIQDQDSTTVIASPDDLIQSSGTTASAPVGIGEGGEIYTIDAAKRMKYDQLFPVEAKKFSYDSNFASKSIEDALDDRVKKKADRYCK